MAKNKQGKAAPAPKATVGKTVNRKRRNAAERKSLPKAYKMLYAGDRFWLKLINQVWVDSKDKKKQADQLAGA